MVLECDSREVPNLLSHPNTPFVHTAHRRSGRKQPNPIAAPARDLDRADGIIGM
ncbi:hypothetical protein MA5S0921_2087 [Mycobacteroides abscessus 5S-0921]|uniref:Uncharacterized protein n=1 Tax=Mycobacteroides abscessus subsp. bolletii 1513 TaxID=1299321 RepID=X8DNY8_9MYCO|nr:hypothetical protein MA5S0304_1356 [Mycobacteroides abscessus 5S-0304]EIU35727.1 hypothetical protein MA5S1212_0045 [Mycobacteroides abscessus 5S-1212]EIU45682.1 hypothetical protein MA5S1215_1090 [Mycobacteroides abscessus 5S-1215]EIU92902.1 hypothetical protein MA5S0921_2087 [Mycobacteroides abscessus 5S-0921]EUA69413.1 hypothetical protein I540_2456 [Mycobacteroides abscessus subsp. bolletii 1513]